MTTTGPIITQNTQQHACVRAAEDIELIRVTRPKYYAHLPLKIMDDRLAIFVFFLFCFVSPSPSSLSVYSVQAGCASSVSSCLFLVNFKHHL